MKRQWFVFAAAFAVAFSGCAAPAAQPSSSVAPSSLSSSSDSAEALGPLAAAGGFEGSVYRNTALGFSITFPEKWTLNGPEKTLELQMQQAQDAYGDAESVREAARQGRMEYLASAEAPAPGAPASFLLQTAPAVALTDLTVEQYARQMVDAAAAQYRELNVEAKTSVAPRDAGGRDAATASVAVTLSGVEIYQSYTLVLCDNALLIVTATAYDGGQATQIEGILSNATFA